MSEPHRKLRVALLAAGAALGALLAAGDMFQWRHGNLPPDAVARVGDDTILKSDYLHLLGLMNQERRNPLDAAGRQRLLNRLIDEKLLLRRSVELGLPWSDGDVSKALVSAMIETIASDASTRLPSDVELEDFLAANRDYFNTAPRLRLRRMAFRGEDARERALAARRRLGGEDWSQVAAALANPVAPELPATLLPAPKLRDYLGAELAAAALGLQPGAYSDAIAESNGYSILWLLGMTPERAPPLAEIREQVVQEYQRRAEERALREYLEQLRGEASLTIDQAFVEQLGQAQTLRQPPGLSAPPSIPPDGGTH